MGILGTLQGSAARPSIGGSRTPPLPAVGLDALAEAAFLASRDAVHRRADRWFARAMVVQAVVAVLLTLVAHPPGRAEGESSVLRAFVALLVGGSVAAGVTVLARVRPGRESTRHAVAVGQVVFSGLFLHATGGRETTHLHVFASLAVLSAYRDWRVLATATAVAVFDHAVRGLLVPYSVYDVIAGAAARWVEHSTWLVLEAGGLSLVCLHADREMREGARRRTVAEQAKDVAQAEAAQATAALAMQGRFNAELIRGETEDGLLAAVCQTAVRVGGYRFAWVGYAVDPEGTVIETRARAGHEAGWLDAVERVLGGDRRSSPAGRAIRTGQAICIPDLALDESSRAILPEAKARGYRGVVCVPLNHAGRTFGVLGLYLSEVRAVPAHEMELLRDLAENLSFGVATARVRAESERTHAQVARQASLLDEARDAIVVCDLEQRVGYWNRSAERIYGWTPEEATGRSIGELLHGKDPAVAGAMAAVRAKGEWVGELGPATKDGRTLAVESRWTLVTDPDGTQTILRIDTDVTERKQLERQFLRAQRLDGIGALAGGIAHDLNNMLAPVMAGVGVLKLGERDAKRLNVIATIETSTQRAASMVGQVLSFARGVDGRRSDVEVRRLVRDIERIVDVTFLKTTQLRTRVPADVWTVPADPTQIHQVLLNLCVNARDAMPAGGTITVSAENVVLDAEALREHGHARPGPFVRLSVEDTGTGMPPEVLARLFEPFFTTKEPGKGTGLGLASCQTIVKSHGGFLRVETAVGKGSRFDVFLPAQGRLSATPAREAAPELPSGNGQLVLVVDDEETVRRIVTETLESFGYRVLAVADGSEAVDLYEQRRREIAAVFTDMTMPGMDGATTIRCLRRIDPEVRIVVASGLRPHDASLGIDPELFLPKPFTTGVLLRALRRALATPASVD